jgi:hypothetical protein
MTTATETGERRRYWLSLAALVFVLPGAVLVNSWDSLSEWRRSHMRSPVVVERGATQRYAGAQWQLTGLTRLPAGTSGASVIVAEFDATVDDPALLQNSPCTVVLTDGKGRRWQPVFLPGRVVRQGRPAAADKPRCSALARAEKGKTIAMAETFTVPEDAADLALSLTIGAARPAFLVFR